MGRAATMVTRAVRYVGAGTVECLVSDATRDFYFLEMNTRLQVEHPVTEMVTGLDLVREQIMVAAGAPLSFAQSDINWHGHAIECRVYAEDPEQNFMPAPGHIHSLRVPAGPGIRDDGGITANMEVSIYYDPMISKLAAWGRTRAEAIDRLRRALDEYTVGGIKTTLPFFREIVRDAEFIEGRLDTGFIERFFARRQERLKDAPALAETDEVETKRRDMALIAAALDYAQEMQKESSASHQSHERERSHWRQMGRAALLRSRDI
jgi:acetyl-CoA carboxylase biotin carboxylase subunit